MQPQLPEIIGLCGISGAGKDTAGYWLRAKYGYYRRPLADGIREVISLLTGVPFKDLCGLTPETRLWRSQPNEDLGGKTPVEAMQAIGEELKVILHQDLWINKVIRQHGYPTSKSVITDVRFDFEIEAIQQAGGVVFYINNPRVQRKYAHRSENAAEYESLCDETIKNDSSREAFFYQLDQTLNQYAASNKIAA